MHNISYIYVYNISINREFMWIYDDALIQNNYKDGICYMHDAYNKNLYCILLYSSSLSVGVIFP